MRVHRYRHFSRIVEGGGIETDYEYQDGGRWTLAADTKKLEEENARLRRACSVLYHGFIRIIHEVKSGATDTEVNAICREMLGIEVVNNDTT